MNSFLDGGIHSVSIRVVGEKKSWRWNEDDESSGGNKMLGAWRSRK